MVLFTATKAGENTVACLANPAGWHPSGEGSHNISTSSRRKAATIRLEYNAAVFLLSGSRVLRGRGVTLAYYVTEPVRALHFSFQL